jgi:hypothetical protein
VKCIEIVGEAAGERLITRGDGLGSAVATRVFASGFVFRSLLYIVAPNGRTLRLRTVWVIGHDGGSPTFVTAYPV